MKKKVWFIYTLTGKTISTAFCYTQTPVTTQNPIDKTVFPAIWDTDNLPTIKLLKTYFNSPSLLHTCQLSK